MSIFRHSMTRRDAMLLLLGAVFMHIFATIFSSPSTESESFVINAHLHDIPPPDLKPLPPPPDPVTRIQPVERTPQKISSLNSQFAELAEELPQTSIVHHAPGFTLFRNLYMSNGTLYILSPNRSFPDITLMTSSGVEANSDPDNEAKRAPTQQNLDFITPEFASRRWGGDFTKGERNHILTVDGNTVLFNDPKQFLRHYYHFVAELFFGVQAFWHGAFSSPIQDTIPDLAKSSNSDNWNAYPTNPTSIHVSTFRLHHEAVPPIQRAIFIHSNADGWRDNPGFNAYFLRSAYPGLTVEHEEDWNDRVVATNAGPGGVRDRAWHFPLVLLVDRTAAFKGQMCGSHTQRTAAEAWEYMRNLGQLRGERVGGWWEPVRDAVLRFAGAGDATASYRELESGLGGTQDKLLVDSLNVKLELPMPKKVVVTYISRQGGNRRKLTDLSHEGLVSALREVCERRGWELNVMEAEKLSKDEQLQVISRTTFLLGVHGNGLTHLVFMPPTRVSTVIEIFYPGGFAHDYHWTSRALGMSHFAVWNDTHYTHPNEPTVEYPEGFQENYIPVHGPAVAKLIEDRFDGKV